MHFNHWEHFVTAEGDKKVTNLLTNLQHSHDFFPDVSE